MQPKNLYFCLLKNLQTAHMKNRITLILICLFTLGGLSAQILVPGAETMNDAMQKAENWKRIFNKEINYDIGNNYDLKYYRFFWNINPAVYYISGQVTSHFVITVANTQFIQFELSNSLTVDSVKYHGNHVSYTHNSKTVTIDLNTQIAAQTLDSVTIWYQGAPGNSGGFGSFITSTHSGTPVMWTLSEPYGSSDWWPCKNVLSDKADSIDIFVRTPDQYRAASNGLLVDEQTDGSFKLYHWRHRYPIESYLVAIAVTNYAVYSDYANLSTGPLEILNYVYPENLTYAMGNTPQVIPCLELYDSLAGPYPFASEKYGHAQFGWGGGMEHQTMSFMGSFSHELIAHELAHMWFGDAITCGSWQDIWLNEGFATYLTGLTFENLFSGSSWMQWKTQLVDNITSDPGGSVWCDDTTNVYRIFSGRLSYNKGAYLLHMLRWVMGDTGFYQAIHNYILDPNLRYGYARTSDFIAHAEAVYGDVLDWFFDQWFTGQGYPEYSIHAAKYPDNEIHVMISQTQSHPSVGFFKMPVPVRFSINNQDTIVVFDNTYNNQEFIIHLDFDPLQITFDPDLWLVSKNNTISMSIDDFQAVSDFRISPNPVSDVLVIESDKTSFSSVIIYDLSGKVIFSADFKETRQMSFNLEELAGGTYLLNIFSKESHFSTKIVRW